MQLSTIIYACFIGSAVLTYFGKWDFVEQQTKYELVKDLYVAPGTVVDWVTFISDVYEHVFPMFFTELQGLTEATIAADWWSLGAVLFEILTGKVCVCICMLVSWTRLYTHAGKCLAKLA